MGWRSLCVPARLAWRSLFSCRIFCSSSRERASSSSSRLPFNSSTERKKSETSSDIVGGAQSWLVDTTTGHGNILLKPKTWHDCGCDWRTKSGVCLGVVFCPSAGLMFRLMSTCNPEIYSSGCKRQKPNWRGATSLSSSEDPCRPGTD